MNTGKDLNIWLTNNTILLSQNLIKQLVSDIQIRILFGGKHAKAIAHFTLVNRNILRDVFVYFYRARAYEQKGDRKNAIADYRTTQAIAWDDNLRKQIRAALERLGAEQTKKR